MNSGRGTRVLRALLAALLTAPFAVLLVDLARGWDTESAAELFEPTVFALFGRSFLIALGATLLATLLGAAAALGLSGAASPARSGRTRWLAACTSRAVELAVFLPLLVPPVLQVAVLEKLAERGGLLHALFPSPAGDAVPFPVRGPWSAALVLGISYAPLVLYFTAQGWRASANELTDAARVHLTPLHALLRVRLPLALPAIASGAAVVFALSLLNYEVPRLLDVTTYAVLVGLKFESQANPGLALLFALPLVVCSFAVLATSFAWADRRGFALTGREAAVHLHSPRRSARRVVVFWLWIGTLVALPLAVILSFVDSPALFWRVLVTDWERLVWSALTGLVTATIAALVAAVLVGLRPARRGWLATWLLLALPGTLLASALLAARGWIPEWSLDAYDSWWILVAAGVFRFAPVACLAVLAHRRTVPSEQWRAAALLRDRPRRWFRVELPLLAPGLAVGAVGVLVLQSQELAANVLLAPPGYQPLIVRIYNLLHYDPERNVLAVLCLFHALGVLAVAGVMVGVVFRRR